MATHSSILAWRMPWTEEPGGLQSMGSQRVRHDRVTEHSAAQSALGKRKEPQVRVGGSRKTEVGSGKANSVIEDVSLSCSHFPARSHTLLSPPHPIGSISDHPPS